MDHEAFRSVGVTTPKPQVVSNSMSVRIGLAETGRFLTMVAPSMLRFGGAGRRLKILPTRTEMQPVDILTVENRTPNPIATLFIKELRALAKPLARSKEHLPSASETDTGIPVRRQFPETETKSL